MGDTGIVLLDALDQLNNNHLVEKDAFEAKQNKLQVGSATDKQRQVPTSQDAQGTVSRQTSSSSTQPATQLARQAARKKNTEEEEREGERKARWKGRRKQGMKEGWQQDEAGC